MTEYLNQNELANHLNSIIIKRGSHFEKKKKGLPPLYIILERHTL